MSQAQSFDASIPVVTEVPESRARLGEDLLPGEAPSGTRATLSKRAEMAAELEAEAIDGWSEAEWAMMEHRLSERIMHQLHRAWTSCWNSASRTAWPRC